MGRMLTEDNFGQARYNYTGEIKWRILGGFNTGWHFADDIILTSDEALEQDRVRSRLPGSKYVKGFNVEMGDPDPFFGILQTGKTIQEQQYVGKRVGRRGRLTSPRAKLLHELYSQRPFYTR